MVPCYPAYPSCLSPCPGRSPCCLGAAAPQASAAALPEGITTTAMASPHKRPNMSALGEFKEDAIAMRAIANGKPAAEEPPVAASGASDDDITWEMGSVVQRERSIYDSFTERKRYVLLGLMSFATFLVPFSGEHVRLVVDRLGAAWGCGCCVLQSMRTCIHGSWLHAWYTWGSWPQRCPVLASWGAVLEGKRLPILGPNDFHHPHWNHP